MLGFKIGQRESGFCSERTESQTESCQHPVPYYYIDKNVFLNNLPFVLETLDRVLGYGPFIYEVVYGAFMNTFVYIHYFGLNI